MTTTSAKLKPFEKLSSHAQAALLQAFTKNYDALEGFEKITDDIENFQVAKQDDISESYNYVFTELLENVDLPYDVAYIVAGIDLEKDQITQKELELLMQIIRKVTFRGREAGIKLYKALKDFGAPIQAVTELQMMQGEIATEQFKLESEVKALIAQYKVDAATLEEAWKAANPEHPALIRFEKAKAKAHGKPVDESKQKKAAKNK